MWPSTRRHTMQWRWSVINRFPTRLSSVRPSPFELSISLAISLFCFHIITLSTYINGKEEEEVKKKIPMSGCCVHTHTQTHTGSTIGGEGPNQSSTCNSSPRPMVARQWDRHRMTAAEAQYPAASFLPYLFLFIFFLYIFIYTHIGMNPSIYFPAIARS